MTKGFVFGVCVLFLRQSNNSYTIKIQDERFFNIFTRLYVTYDGYSDFL